MTVCWIAAQGNCTTPPPAAWMSDIVEPVMPGMCIIRVSEDFAETEPKHKEIWLHNLYILVERASFDPGTSSN